LKAKIVYLTLALVLVFSLAAAAIVPTSPAMAAVPSPPTLSSPVGVTVTGTSILFEWNPSAGATWYYLRVSTNPDQGVTSAYFWSDLVGDVQTKTLTGFPDDHTTYYWWVFAGNAEGGNTRAEVEPYGRSFINGVPVPPPPTLSSPDDGAMVPGASIDFEWNASVDATRYYLRVSTNPDQGVVEDRFFESGWGDVLSCTVPGFPDDSTEYYWWVFAGNNAGQNTRAEIDPHGRSFINGVHCIASSTMHFEGALTDAGGGVYNGTIPMTAGTYYTMPIWRVDRGVIGINLTMLIGASIRSY